MSAGMRFGLGVFMLGICLSEIVSLADHRGNWQYALLIALAAWCSGFWLRAAAEAAR